MDPMTSLDLSPAVAVVRELDGLRAQGWTVADGLDGVALTLGAAPSRPAEIEAALAGLRPFLAHLEISTRLGGETLALGRVGDSLEVVKVPVAPPDRFYEDEDLERAQEVWERDAGSALALPADWSADARVDLASSIDTHAELDLKLCLERATVTAHVLGVDPDSVRRLLPREGRRRVYASLSGTVFSEEHFGQISLLEVQLDGDLALSVPAAVLTPAHERALVDESRVVLAPPSALLPVGPEREAWAAERAHLTSLALLGIWSLVANEVHRSAGGARLEFKGYRRTQVPVPHGGAVLDEIDVAGTLAIHRWLVADESPDRLVALRQVTSLNPPEEVLGSASDILEGARLIYVGLRSDAVVEAVAEYRAARSHALDAVRQTGSAAQAMVKAAAERSIATFAGVIALFFAHTNKTLTDAQARTAVLMIVALLGVLTLLALLVEGPLLTAATKVEQDLDETSPMLSKSELQAIAQLPSLKSVRKRALFARVVIPSIYVTAAIALLVFGYPQRFG